jgi:hypothetical protein
MPSTKSSKVSVPKQSADEIADGWLENSLYTDNEIEDALGGVKKDGEVGKVHECDFSNDFQYSGTKALANRVKVRQL